MTDYRGIAGVTKTLRNLLKDRMQNTDVEVTMAPPDVAVSGASKNRLNAYLFQISRNAELSNQDIPERGHRAAYGRPPLSLNLHYLLTAFAASEEEVLADLQAQEILGDAMATLNDFSVITDSLRAARDGGEIDKGDPILDPTLRQEFERIKITMEPVNLEDMSSLWTALPAANFRRSVGYEVSVVQIETRHARQVPPLVGEPPVGGPRLSVVPLKRPCISELRFRRPGDEPETERRFLFGRIADTLIIQGTALRDERSRVLVKDVDVTAAVTTHEPDRIELVLPDDGGLQPGAVPLKVIHDVAVGDPPSTRTAFTSNAAVFMLVPRIDSLTAELATDPPTLQIDGARLFHPDRPCLALVGDETFVPDDYTIKQSATIKFDLPDDLAGGDYPVRVQVGGAESIDRHVLTIPP